MTLFCDIEKYADAPADPTDKWFVSRPGDDDSDVLELGER